MVDTCNMIPRRQPSVCLSPHGCVMCYKDGESVDHVLLRISIVKKKEKIHKASLSVYYEINRSSH